ncbi:DUF1295 domain-containing protein [Aquisalimonas asiatica]|uniref:Steroid 5-alpha reductase family enzyme n=1 Tax=Aquisalimonas asiatica TaxID=406100 RepID=A0A1H8S2N7_9GAMM|nr:DUF1295 domain-containing protein [Aquisalimonas asiatica]SEO72796.1 Steroid 5-alpha reductase family enzyme [Aquisalimonas asiatica]
MSTGAAILLGLVAALGLMLLVWLASLQRRDASLVDRFWGAGFVLLAWVYWFSAGLPAAGLVMVLPVTLWGLRLSAYLSWRNWGHGEDYRYREMRDKHGSRFPWVSLWTVFMLQGVLMWLIAMPLVHGARVPGGDALIAPLAVLGLAVWAFGFVWESLADAQLARFKAEPENRGRVMDRGVWRYSRHPNYFGEIVLWWGFFLIAAAAGGWWTAVSAALMTFLLIRVSGVTLLEKKLNETRPEYRDYVARTNALLPGPPRRAGEPPAA